MNNVMMTFENVEYQTASVDSNDSFPNTFFTPQENCRKSRLHINSAVKCVSVKWGYTKQTLSYILRFLFWSSGYNRHVSVISKLYSLLILCACWYQVVYEIYKMSGCVDFDCHPKNVTIGPNMRLEFAAYLSSALGSACSYAFMLLCLSIMYKRNSNAISPYVALKDMGNSKAKIVLGTWVILTVVYTGFMLLYTYLETAHRTLDTTDIQTAVRIFSDVLEFFTQWVAIVSMFAFSCSAFAIGTFASDTFRRIKQHKDGTIDDVIVIHRELRSIVTETTNAYSGWFLLHWLLYGVTVIIGFVVVALHKFGHDQTDRRVYFGTFFTINAFLFVFPCICAAYITTACGTIPARINTMISEEWEEGHIFRERRNLQMFVSYCTVSPVCFKIGRVTFTSTLAWCSFFFGGTGLLFHFF